MSADEILAAAARIRAAGLSPPRHARDPVNLPMVRNWLEVMGDTNPAYERDGLAPPAMTQVWTMRGLRPAPDPDDPLGAISAVLDKAGFTSVVATNSDQTYHRYLREGERVAVRSRLADVTGPKRTALGEGWFATIESTWFVGDEPVATMRFRILKFKPAPARDVPKSEPAPARDVPKSEPAPARDIPEFEPAPAPSREGALTPVVSQDTAFFWAGTAVGELRVQRCEACRALRHPPGPACPRCGSLQQGYVVAAGTGEIYSYVVHHHPPVPGRAAPFVVALVALPEGVRMVGELLAAGPEQVRIGAPVRVDFVRVDSSSMLPAWRLA